MNLFTQFQVQRLARVNGFGPRQAKIMGALALCEAPVEVDGQTFADADMVGDQALANDKWGYSYGFWQIRSLREHFRTGQTRDAFRLLDPDFAAKSAREIFLHRQEVFGNGFTAWSTFNNGAFKAYLPELFPPPPKTHVVVSGDTLSKIAALNDTTWENLARINGLHPPYTIHIGDHIQLP